MIPDPADGAISDPDLEQGVLAGATVNAELARQAALVVTEGHFTTERARFHWRCIARCVEQGIDANRISIHQAAKALRVDGTVTLGYLTECDDSIPFDIVGYDDWLMTLDELRTRRRLIERLQAVKVRVCDRQQPGSVRTSAAIPGWIWILRLWAT
jgi:replicative DNA helicase